MYVSASHTDSADKFPRSNPSKLTASCATDDGRQLCLDADASCVVWLDGYYVQVSISKIVYQGSRPHGASITMSYSLTCCVDYCSDRMRAVLSGW